jgi:hypothetical protein
MLIKYSLYQWFHPCNDPIINIIKNILQSPLNSAFLPLLPFLLPSILLIIHLQLIEFDYNHFYNLNSGMDEGDVLIRQFRKNSSQRKWWRLWTMRLITFSESGRSTRIRMLRPSITNKNPTPMSIILLISSSGDSANSTNPSSIASTASLCRIMEQASIHAVRYL